MARRGWLRNWLEFVPAWAVVQMLCWAPLPIARILAAGFARLLYLARPRWRRVARRNLELAFPALDERARGALLLGCYSNLGRNLLAFARLPRLDRDNISDWIVYEGFEHFEKALARGKGVIFLTAHLGGWELSSAAHALYGHPMDVMVRPLDNPLLDRLVDRRRRLFGNRTLAKTDSARQTLAALRANRAVGILADQNAAGDDGLFVRFFDRQASATKGVAQLAARTGAAVIPGFALWNDRARRYVLKFYPPLELASSGERGEDLREKYPALPNDARDSHPRPPRAVAVDPPPLEDPARGRARPLCRALAFAGKEAGRRRYTEMRGNVFVIRARESM